MIDYACPICRTPMTSPETMIGQSETCPKCGAVIIVARPIATAPSPDRPSGEFRPIMTVARPRGIRAGAFGAAGVVIGAVACVTLWFPLGWLHTAVIGAAGLASAAVGFLASRRRRRSDIAILLAGGVMCGAAIYLSLSPGARTIDEPATAVDGATPSPASPGPLPIGMGRQWDDRTLKVIAVKIDTVPLKSVTGDSRSQDKFLTIVVEASNTSAFADREITYTTLRGVSSSRDRTYASLSDSKGKFYKRISFGPETHPSGGVHRSAPLAGSESVRDILIFERPVEGAGPYRLELPLRNLGGVGAACWEIPESALR